MKSGLREFLENGIRFLTDPADSTYVGIRSTAVPATSFYLTLPDALPGVSSLLTVGTDGQVGYTVSGGGSGDVSLTLPTDVFDVSGSPGDTITVTFDNQSVNTFFAGPSTGGAGTPAFRAIAWADVSSLAGTSGSSFAVGNDARFHTQGTDTGTTNSTFSIDSDGGSPILLKNASGVLQLRNSGDTAAVDLVVGNLTVQGTTTTVDSETVTLADNILLLNSNFTTGTPTEQAGLQVLRGSSTTASVILWDEATDQVLSGIAGSEKQLARIHEQSFVNANLVSGTITVTHNLGVARPIVQVVDNNGAKIEPDAVTGLNSTSSCVVDISSFGTITGTWYVVVSR